MNKIDFASYRPILTLGLATSTALGFMFTLPSQATAFSFTGFTGDFDPRYWTLTNNNADGSTDASLYQVILTGGDNGSNLPGTTDWTIPINSARAGNISFYWSYFTLDTPGFDSAGFLLNGIYTPLAIQDGDFYFSTPAVSINVITGDIFGFRATTSSNSDGAPVFSVYSLGNFSAAAVPEPSTILGAVMGLGFGAFFKRKLRS